MSEVYTSVSQIFKMDSNLKQVACLHKALALVQTWQSCLKLLFLLTGHTIDPAAVTISAVIADKCCSTGHRVGWQPAAGKPVYHFAENQAHQLLECSDFQVNTFYWAWFCSLIATLCFSFSPTGFGGCVDLIVDGVSLLNKLGVQPTDQPLHHDYLENAEQLAQSFAYFFAPGAAAE